MENSVSILKSTGRIEPKSINTNLASIARLIKFSGLISQWIKPWEWINSRIDKASSRNLIILSFEADGSELWLIEKSKVNSSYLKKEIIKNNAEI